MKLYPESTTMSSQPPAQPPFLSSSISPEPASAPPATPRKERPLLGLWITLSVLVVLGAAALLTYNYYFHASIRPTKLSETELNAINQKLESIESASGGVTVVAGPNGEVGEDVLLESGRVNVLPSGEMPPAPAEEPRDPRMLVLTQRELNGILNHNTEFGQYVKIDLKPGYFDVTTIVPVDEEVAFLGGKTLRCSLDLTFKKAEDGDLVLAVRDINLLGVPIPAAWLEGMGIMKGDNLLKDLKSQYPWFEKFSEGIEYIDLSSGELKIQLAE